jgi:hypothetical protein
MLQLIIGSLARNAGSAAAGWLVAHGVASSGTTAEIVTGIVVLMLTQGWSLLHKAGKVKA